jgi:hypothetical protein
VNRSWLRTSLFGLVWSSGMVGGAARAQTPAGPASVVEIVATGEPRTTEALDQLVRELVAPLRVELEWSNTPTIDPRQVLARRADDERVLVRAWVDLSDDSRAKIYVANGGSERFIVRFVPEPNGYDAVAREALGQILESSIAAFVASNDAGIPRADAVREVAHEARVAVDEPPSKPRPRGVSLPPRMDAGLAYQMSILDTGPIVQHGVTALFDLALPWERPVRFASWASAGYRAPASFEGSDIGVSLSSVPLRLVAGIEGTITPRFSIRALAGAGADVVFIAPIAVSPETRAATTSTTVVPVFTVMGAADIRLTVATALLVGVGYDVDLSRQRYDVARDQGPAPAWTPWVAHPTVLVGFLLGFEGRRF